jgi:hypothetical protein
MELLPFLTQTDDFKRRGERRQLSLMKNEGFRLALIFAVADYQLSGSQQNFWNQAFSKLSVEILAGEADAKAAKKRRKPRKRRGGDDRVAREGGRTPPIDEDDDFESSDETDDDTSKSAEPPIESG